MREGVNVNLNLRVARRHEDRDGRISSCGGVGCLPSAVCHLPVACRYRRCRCAAAASNLVTPPEREHEHRSLRTTYIAVSKDAVPLYKHEPLLAMIREAVLRSRHHIILHFHARNNNNNTRSTAVQQHQRTHRRESKPQAEPLACFVFRVSRNPSRHECRARLVSRAIKS
jgi:hypothetical protein